MNAAVEVKGTWGMMDNDQIGDCTCAAAGHLIMEWTAAAQSKMARQRTSRSLQPIPPSLATIPTTGLNDNGAQELDVLNHWRQHRIAGHKIQVYIALEPSNHTHVMDAVWIFGGC